nr:hypothetical protein [Catenibacterium mitsuokai]
MINAEKFRKELLELSNQNIAFAVRRENQNAVVRCDSIKRCTDCLFGRGRCSVNSTKWLLSEYKEPPVKVSKLEYEFLKWSEKKGHKYIVRDKINHLFIFKDAPIKRENRWVPESSYCSIALFDNLFKFIKQEDEEPRAIKDILENCEVIEDAKEL